MFLKAASRRKTSRAWLIFLPLLFSVLALLLGLLALLRGAPEAPAREATPLQLGQPDVPTAPKPLLVNSWNSVPADYVPELTQLENGLCVESSCYPALQEMMDGCRAAGLEPVICSAYRTQEEQESLYKAKLEEFLAQGLPRSEAAEEAGKVVALPGTSEHQLGLAVDIVDMNYQHLDDAQTDTAVQQWLLQNCWKYGFILRYPSGKSDLTGVIFEPWHYRYVGEEIAAFIFENGLCLEEYLAGN